MGCVKLELFDNLERFDKEIATEWREYLDTHMPNRRIGKEERDSIIAKQIASLRKRYATKLLQLTYLKPKGMRAYGLYTTAYLDDTQYSIDITHVSSTHPDVDFDMVDGMYQCSQHVGKVCNDSDLKHEINLLYIEDTIELERIPIYQASNL